MAEYTLEMKKMRKIEKAMVTEKGTLDGTMIHKQVQKKLMYDTMTHGGCSFLGAMVPIIPFIFNYELHILLIGSILASLLVLFALGVFMGLVIKEHLAVSGLKMVIVGLVVALIVRMLGLGH